MLGFTLDRRWSTLHRGLVCRLRRLTTNALAVVRGAGGIAVTAGMAVIGGAAHAQQPSPSGPASSPNAARARLLPPWRVSVRADNDAFNFWRAITDRPDEEYTNGDQVTIELSAAPWWGKRFAKHSTPCTGREPPGGRCLTTAVSIAQDMYTPRPKHEPGVVPNWRDERPYAALLYTSAEARIMSERSLQTVGLLLGVTGPPAFGEFAQRTAHKLSGVYSRNPVGWNTQIGFEPLVTASAQTTHRYAGRTAAGDAVVDVAPYAGASVGNVLTAGHAGVRTRLGFHLSSPWWTSEWQSRPPVELYVVGGLRGEAVAHNITLDGNTLGADRRVARVPLVGEYSVGLGARIRGVVAEWRAVTRSKEYRTGPTAHAYSQLVASYEVPAHGPR
jgi:hypothetical protein